MALIKSNFYSVFKFDQNFNSYQNSNQFSVGDTEEQSDKKNSNANVCGGTISGHVVSSHAGLLSQDLLQGQDNPER